MTRSSALCSVLLLVVAACGSPRGNVDGMTNSPAPVSAGTIAFESFRGSTSYDIWIVNADGTGLKQLTDQPDFEFRPAWSPDGARIAFVAIHGQGWHIYLMDADGSDLVRLTRGPERADTPAWSPEGDRIAFACRVVDRPDICIMNEDGTGVVRITKGPAADLFPTWSPDGSRIFFVRILSGNPTDYGDVFVMNADGTGVTQLTEGQHVGDYAISPDGTKLVVHDTKAHTLRLIAPYVGTFSTLIDTDLDAHYLHPAWSPDGAKIALAGDGNLAIDLYVLNSDGTGLMKVPNGQDASDPAWQPAAAP